MLLEPAEVYCFHTTIWNSQSLPMVEKYRKGASTTKAAIFAFASVLTFSTMTYLHSVSSNHPIGSICTNGFLHVHLDVPCLHPSFLYRFAMLPPFQG